MVINQIRLYREQKGISQETLAKLVSVSRQTIISIEKGSYNPSVELGLRLARVLDVTMDDLFQLEAANENS